MNNTTHDDIAELFERHRKELGVHCYRMMGSYTESEDMVQESFIKAMRGFEHFDGRSSPRTWLYRIATNTCIDELRKRKRHRTLPFYVTEPVGSDGSIPDAGEQIWVEPFPQHGLDGLEEDVVRRDTIELAFIAAIQQLPPRQRAVFISRDILGWTTRATAIVCDIEETAVKSALQRARSTMREHLSPDPESWSQGVAVSQEEAQVVATYVDAHDRGDSDALAQTLREDLRVAYPQIPLWSSSRDAFIQATREQAPPGDYRFVVTAANLQPALAIYHRPPGGEVFELIALEVIKVVEGTIVEIIDFYLPETFAAYGLAASLSE